MPYRLKGVIKNEIGKILRKNVIITTYDGEKYKGFIDVYLQPNDNDGEEGIGLDIGMWFDESDIKEILLDKRS